MKTDAENPHISDSPENLDFYIQRKKRGEIAGGLFLMVLGALWLLHEMGFQIPAYIYSWATAIFFWGAYRLIKFGLFDFWGYFLIVFATINFVDVDFPIKKYFWPIAVIAGGAFLIISSFKNKKSRYWKNWKHNSNSKN